MQGGLDTVINIDYLNLKVGELVRRHNLSADSLTGKQLADAIRQAIQSGDFVRNLVTDGRQAVVYIPWREVESLRSLYHELLYAVEKKYPGETRHQTALRYIQEAESKESEPNEKGQKEV